MSYATTPSLIIAVLLCIVVAGWLYLNHRHDRAIHRIKVAHCNETQRYVRNLQEQLLNQSLDAEADRGNAAQAMEMLHEQHQAELAAARSEIAKRTEAEAALVEHMANKLSLASAAFHSSQCFKDAREANNLSNRGRQLAQRMRSSAPAPADVIPLQASNPPATEQGAAA